MRAFRRVPEVALGPLVRLLARLRVHPNWVSLACFLLTLLAGWLYVSDLRWGAIVFLVSGALDSVDGQLARATGRESRFGAFLDSNLDRLGEMAVFGGIALHFREWGPWPWIILLGLGGALMVSYARARAEGLGVSPRGGMSRAVRYFWIIITSLLGDTFFLWLYGVFVLLVWASFGWRLARVYNLTSKPGS